MGPPSRPSAASNPFKKRSLNDISKSSPQVTEAKQSPAVNTSYYTANGDNVEMEDSTTTKENRRQSEQPEDQQMQIDASALIQKTQKDQAKDLIEDDWKKLKLANSSHNNDMRGAESSSSALLNNADGPLPLNKDGTLSFFWFDAHEETQSGDIYLFGKIFNPQQRCYTSCSLKINGMERTIFALPKINESQVRSTMSEEEQNKLAGSVF
mmetsp:Transcript_30842/g.22431  ORF Transcript_30842/g.22431 Transcript_30842/m.22431 type:complete len:210 (+) Transcript_30842:665-1294(+)